MGATPTLVGFLVHAPWPGGKLHERVVRATSQPPADFLRPSRSPLMGRLQLALIAQPVAVATCEHAPDDIQPENPAGAVPALEPQPLSAKPARRPDGGDMTARGPRSSPLWRRAASRARVAEGGPSGASPVRRRTCNPQRSICLRLHGAPSIAPFFSSPNNRNRLASLGPAGGYIPHTPVNRGSGRHHPRGPPSTPDPIAR